MHRLWSRFRQAESAQRLRREVQHSLRHRGQLLRGERARRIRGRGRTRRCGARSPARSATSSIRTIRTRGSSRATFASRSSPAKCAGEPGPFPRRARRADETQALEAKFVANCGYGGWTDRARAALAVLYALRAAPKSIFVRYEEASRHGRHAAQGRSRSSPAPGVTSAARSRSRSPRPVPRSA